MVIDTGSVLTVFWKLWSVFVFVLSVVMRTDTAITILQAGMPVRPESGPSDMANPNGGTTITGSAASSASDPRRLLRFICWPSITLSTASSYCTHWSMHSAVLTLVSLLRVPYPSSSKVEASELDLWAWVAISVPNAE